MIKNIVLIGITGVGKTTIGKCLAQKLNVEFVDLDRKIEQRCGVDIPTIFHIEGEESFRNRETVELMLYCGVDSSDNGALSRTSSGLKQEHVSNLKVVAVGGGCILREQNRKILSDPNNYVIQLYADVGIVVERVSKFVKNRPTLNHQENLEYSIQNLYKKRKAFYDEVTDLFVDISSFNLYQSVEYLAKQIDYLRK